MNRRTAAGRDILGLLQRRETTDSVSNILPHKLHVTKHFIDRLGLEKELEGHTGCVNCLEWNENERILASASDDLQVILWDPFSYKKLHTMQTGHHGNIFSVKFLPKSDDNIIVTGAGDSRIRVHDISSAETTHVCSCHTGRVKRIATAPNCPSLFWSAAEDGTVMQYDLRAPHICTKEKNVLINLLNHLGRHAEAKCIAINPRRPEMLALGANDPFVRLYDRRMIKLSSVEFPPEFSSRGTWETRQNGTTSQAGQGDPGSCLPHGCSQYFVAGHLPIKQHDFRKRFRNLASTYLTFSADGNELLVNLGGEQIYLFDINNKRHPLTFDVVKRHPTKPHCTKSYDASNGFPHGVNDYVITFGSNGFDRQPPQKKVKLSNKVESLKQSANEAFEHDKFTLAISLYNLAINDCPNAAILYGNRAAAFMKRSWDGDMYAAMRDCCETIRRDSDHWKAHLRLARCLFELTLLSKADKCLKYFKAKFPARLKDIGFIKLDKDIVKAKNRQNRMNSREEPESRPEREEDNIFERDVESDELVVTSEQEAVWQAEALDYEIRFCGHCNTTTDIKECNFFGRDGQFIVAGSDDGSFFIWDRQTTNIVRVLKGDESIVNCLQPHPTYCMLATSGIDPVVRLWSPRAEDGTKDDREVKDADRAASANQQRMNADPFEVMLLNMGYRIPEDAEGLTLPVQCRTS